MCGAAGLLPIDASLAAMASAGRTDLLVTICTPNGARLAAIPFGDEPNRPGPGEHGSQGCHAACIPERQRAAKRAL